MSGSSGATAVPPATSRAADPHDWSTRKPPSALRRFLELFVLSGFVVAQPLLDVFGNAGETFVFRRIDRTGVLLFTLIVVVGPPLAMWCLGTLAAWIGDTAGVIAHDVLMGLLWVLFGVEILQRFEALPLPVVLIGSLFLGSVAVAVSTSRKELRLWLTYATPAPVVFGLVFLLMSPVSAQVRLSDHVTAKHVVVGNPAPVVVVVLDELPLASLIDADGQLDADLYPNFAALQKQSHTFLNATSNAWATTYSVPSLLTGQLPEAGTIPVATTYPDNLFTLLGNSYDLRVHELMRLCPASLCPRQASDGELPTGFARLMQDGLRTFGQIVDPRSVGTDGDSVLFSEANAAMRAASWGAPLPRGGGDLRVPGRFGAFVDDLDQPANKGRPQLDFLHLMLPHSPWFMLPDGHYYVTPRSAALWPLNDRKWNDDGHFIAVNRQRHLLQVQYADQLIGDLVRQLKRSGQWDKSAVVITADHGVSFERGQPYREASSSTLGEVAWVPLFIKEPGQQVGSTSLENVQLIDVLPTLADILDIDVPWRLDGRSVFQAPRELTMSREFLSDGRRWHLDGESGRRQMLDHSIAHFAPRNGDPIRSFRVGKAATLVGQRVADLPSADISRSMTATFHNPSMWADVDLTAPSLPVYASGRLHDKAQAATALVVSVNGVVGGVSELVGPSDSREFAGLVPPQLLRNGENEVRVYALDKSGRLSPVRLT